MKFNDLGHEESYNLRVYDGGGDTGYVMEATRQFCIADQCERMYWTQFKEPYLSEYVDALFDEV